MATEVMNQRRRIEVQAAALLVLALVMVWMTGANATRRKAKLQKVEWNYCDPEAARTSNITAVGMHPYPPRAGDKVKLLVAGKHGETVNGGLLHFGAYFKDLPLYQGKEDLCRRSKCPSHRSGKFMFKAVEKLPRYTPQGVYQIQVKAEDEHGKEIVCARAKLPVMPEV